MNIVTDSISVEKLKTMSEKMFNQFVKAVIDIDQEIMGVDAELHSDIEQALLEQGSQQGHLWGINIYPNKIKNDTDDWIEFDSMINIRPSWGNNSRFVEDALIRKKIINLVKKFIK